MRYTSKHWKQILCQQGQWVISQESRISTQQRVVPFCCAYLVTELVQSCGRVCWPFPSVCHHLTFSENGHVPQGI